MGLFTARNRQNPFAERKRREAEQKAAEETAAILADPDAMEAIAEAEAEPAKAAPYDTRTAESDDITDAPDVSTFATGGIVELPAEIDEDSSIPPLPDAEDTERAAPAVIEISDETRAKIDAVLNHAITPLDVDKSVDEQRAETREKLADALDVPVESITPLEDRGESKRGRGRPRPQETIDRDNAVHALLSAADADEGISKEALAISLDEKEQQVYSSLRQLSKEGRAETRYVKGHGYRWFAVSPAETA